MQPRENTRERERERERKPTTTHTYPAKIPKLTFTFQTLITAKQITVIILFAYFVK